MSYWYINSQTRTHAHAQHHFCSGKIFACLYMIIGISMVSVSVIRLFLALFNACTEAGLFCRDCVKTRIFGDRWWLGKWGDQSVGEGQPGRKLGTTNQGAQLTESNRKLSGGIREHNPHPHSLEEIEAEEKMRLQEAQAAQYLNEEKKQPGLVIMVSR